MLYSSPLHRLNDTSIKAARPVVPQHQGKSYKRHPTYLVYPDDVLCSDLRKNGNSTSRGLYQHSGGVRSSSHQHRHGATTAATGHRPPPHRLHASPHTATCTEARILLLSSNHFKTGSGSSHRGNSPMSYTYFLKSLLINPHFESELGRIDYDTLFETAFAAVLGPSPAIERIVSAAQRELFPNGCQLGIHDRGLFQVSTVCCTS